jgi:hypothetical protein
VYSHPPQHRRGSGRRQRARLRLTPTNRTVRSRWRDLKAVPHVNPRHSEYDRPTMSCASLCKVTSRGYQTCVGVGSLPWILNAPPFCSPLTLIHEQRRQFATGDTKKPSAASVTVDYSDLGSPLLLSRDSREVVIPHATHAVKHYHP